MNKFLFRAAIGLLMAFFGAITYFTSNVQNPVTGEKQRVQLSPKQEISLGLQSRSQMAAKYGGLYPSQTIQQYVDRVGERVVNGSEAKKAGYPFEFHLLRDSKTVNAFALPGGQVFITAGLMRLLNSEAQLAAVLGHESGHVVGRHAAEHLAKQQLGRSLVTAVGVATTDDRGGGQQAALIAQAVNQVVGLRYGRADELESDRLGFQFMTEAGYDPRGIVEVMQILGSARNGEAPPEFLSSHPNPENRVEKLQALIAQNFPNGVPANLVSGREEFAKNVSGG
ncbi:MULTISPECIES: M48 family metalloprotease [unclassified Microcoleus]|uniref:M48 family metalloprotease n=1 Tax=unclassified Microcoleus TaxID=2642155 RepID=UPI001D2DAA57|nr:MULTISPECIES: M48 family metalloprotease [unclassified Microcoleus]MCC3490337.1 M48 family metalloprotease [Microcoleus sp. PH2017_16_JOR_D_A]MCC3583314.1 M48 family metalloprotease [Microcoleus sp. PH2017_30_WIL_O_A]TAE14027.1 MAG: M48 family peptidase [Oscillatoriales cyanobacterium]TAE25638.1 MAG: M48 family peptidase [Oscillatoriales cyanobacterium]